MPLSLYASGTTTPTPAGVTLATTFTPAIYIVEVDLTNVPNLATLVITFKTSVKPIFGGGQGNINTCQVTSSGVSAQKHLFTAPVQVGTVENTAASWVMSQATNNPAPCDWSIYRLD